MSLIVYRDGLLLSDRMGMSKWPGEDVEYVSEMLKTHIHPSGCFAMAYVGGDKTKRVLTKMMDQLYVILAAFYREYENEKCLILDKEGNPFLPDPLCKSLEDTSFILMTRDRVFMHFSDNPYLAEHDPSETCATGLASDCFRVALAFGLPTKKAFKRAVGFVHPVKPVVDICKMKSLKPFPTGEEADHG